MKTPTILSVTTSFLLLCASCLAQTPAAQTQQPNILFLMCDSMDGRVLDPTSPVSTRLEMPHLRALAATGVNFLNTYTASPQCVPSRAAMFTGRRIDQTQTWNNQQGVAVVPSTGGLDESCIELNDRETCANFRAEQNISATIVDTLRDLGMEPSLYGKVDVGAGILQDEREGNATKSGYQSKPSLEVLTRTADIRKPTKKDPLAITNDTNNNAYKEDWNMLPKCIEFLKNKAKHGHTNEDAQNWMLYCSIIIPHPPFHTNATWLSLVHEDKIPAPKWLSKDKLHPADSYTSQSKSMWRDFNASEVHKVRKTYYAMCAETDYMLGTVIEALKDSGLYNNTFIVFLSDHGEMNMEHRQVWKNSMYEASSRVPLIIAPPPNMPGMRRGFQVTNLTSLLDVYPTLVEMAQMTKPLGGVQMPSFLSGHSLFPFLYEEVEERQKQRLLSIPPYPKNRAVTSQYHSKMSNTGSFMLRKDQYKYIVFTRRAFDPSYTPQLFDVVNDPEELNDISASQPEVVKIMDQELCGIVGDYYSIDAQARTNDVKLYKHFFANNMSQLELRQMFNESYIWFDDADMAKIDAWLKNATATATTVRIAKE